MKRQKLTRPRGLPIPATSGHVPLRVVLQRPEHVLHHPATPAAEHGTEEQAEQAKDHRAVPRPPRAVARVRRPEDGEASPEDQHVQNQL